MLLSEEIDHWAKWCLSEMNKVVNCVYDEIYEYVNKMRWYLINNLSHLLEQHVLCWLQLVNANVY
jgi:hypothetical protein